MRPVSPTHDDPVVHALSEAVGGPDGEHSRGHPWLTAVPILLMLTAITFAVGMVQKSGCWASEWNDTEARYAQMCYSDLPYLYVGRGLAERQWPYTDDAVARERYPAMEYPVGIAYWAWGTAVVSQALHGNLAEAGDRGSQVVSELSSDPDVAQERLTYVAVNAAGFGILAILITWMLTRVNPGRPWDAAGFALAPTLALTGVINWDLLALVFVAGALWAFARDRPLWTGIMIGLGTATKLYPLFLLGGLLIICLRRRRLGDFGLATGAAVASWGLANLPAYVGSPEAWERFWTFNSERQGDLGSIWLVLNDAFDAGFNAHDVNVGSWVFFGAWCVAVLILGLSAPRTPRLAQLGFLIVAGFLLINKVYSPQYVLWLLPLAVLARPRWRDLLIWQSGEILYFASVWWYLGGFLNDRSDDQAGFYWLAIVVRIIAQLYLVAVIVRDMYAPERDPVPSVEPIPPDRPGTPVRSEPVGPATP